MAKVRKLRRGITGENTSITGLQGQIVFDTTKKTVRVHDGSTTGGVEIAKEDLSNTNPIGLAKFADGTAGQIPYFNGTQTTVLNAGSNGQVLRVNGAGNGLTFGGGSAIRAVHTFRDATYNIQPSIAANASPISWTFTKQFADTALYYKGFMPGSNEYSYHAGEYIEFTRTTTFRDYDSVVYVHNIPTGNSLDSIYGYMHYEGYVTAAEIGASTGSVTVTIGWSSRDGSGQRPYTYWNPYQGSARIRGYTTNFQIYEIASSTVTKVT